MAQNGRAWGQLEGEFKLAACFPSRNLVILTLMAAEAKAGPLLAKPLLLTDFRDFLTLNKLSGEV